MYTNIWIQRYISTGETMLQRKVNDDRVDRSMPATKGSRVYPNTTLESHNAMSSTGAIREAVLILLAS